MVSLFIRIHPQIYEILTDLIQFLNADWENGINPTQEQIRQEMGINEIHFLHSFFYAIKHLEFNNYIQLGINDDGDEIILPGDRPFPEHYSYIQYCLEIPIIEL